MLCAATPDNSIQAKISAVRPVFPDYLSISYDYALKNVNGTVKTIVGQSVAPSQNDEIDTDIHFCKSLVSLLKALSPKKNSLARVKIQKVLFETESGENLD